MVVMAVADKSKSHPRFPIRRRQLRVQWYEGALRGSRYSVAQPVSATSV